MLSLEEQLLQAQLLQAQRENKRKAAPFRRKDRIPESAQKKSGRPEGHTASYRRPPESVDETIEIKPTCSQCGGHCDIVASHEHFVTELPEVKPIVRKYITHTGVCVCCGAHQRTSHPDLPSLATGAAGHMLGNRLASFLSQMRIHLGVTLAKVSTFAKQWFGLPLSPAGILSALRRVGRATAATHTDIQKCIRTSEVVGADETGWRVNSESAWAWVFTSSAATLYHIAKSRGSKIPLSILGSEFSGWLVTDFYAAYNRVPGKKSKCLAHLLCALAEVELLQTRRGLWFPRTAMAILREAIALWQNKDMELSGGSFEWKRALIKHRLDKLLEGNYQEPKNRRLANRMRRHKDALLAFLYHTFLPPTNNMSERAVRPLVLQRKISAGNRSQWGADLHGQLTSICVTASQRGTTFWQVVLDALQNPNLSALPPPRP